MKLIYCRFENFLSIYAAMGVTVFEQAFDQITEPIIQIYGPNRCGKTVLMQLLHPWSSINLNGDERNDLSLILPGKIGRKQTVYEINGEVYSITHTYNPTKNGHTITSSFMHNEEEMNPSGGVNTFNVIAKQIIGINKYVFQFVINGTNLLSFGKMTATQRKQALYKATGIDIYDKFHKLSTEDYRYTNKLISSMNATKEFLLSNYGSYDTLCARLRDTSELYQQLATLLNMTKSDLDTLSGRIASIKQQNVEQEFREVTTQLEEYRQTVSTLGDVSSDLYDRLVDDQIKKNDALSQLRSERLMLLKDIDSLYEKINDITTNETNTQRTKNDYNEMLAVRKSLEDKINSIEVSYSITSSSNYLCNMMSLGQTINSICKEIVLNLSDEQLLLLTNMIAKGMDVPTFLLKEESVLTDSDKERAAVFRVRNLINGVDGIYPDDCTSKEGCIYRKTVDTLNDFFKAYQHTTESGKHFTQTDLDQLDHSYKNIVTIQRLLNTNISDELEGIFNLGTILTNLTHHNNGIDIPFIQNLIEEAGKIETKKNLIQQLDNITKSIADMERMMETMHCDASSDSILNEYRMTLSNYKDQVSQYESKITMLQEELQLNEQQRHMLSRIKNINVKELTKRQEKLQGLIDTTSASQQEFNRLNSVYYDTSTKLSLVTKELESLQHADDQYKRTVSDLMSYQESDAKYRVISEATSPTKGKPILVIQEKIMEALGLANRLLDVMYHGDMELLKPNIDESAFDIPFRRGCNVSPDIRYGSQSESAMLSFALSLSLAAFLIPSSISFIPFIDEIDAYSDEEMRDSFVLMLQEIMATLRIEQLFMISHNILPSQYDQIVHVLDITKSIEIEEN